MASFGFEVAKQFYPEEMKVTLDKLNPKEATIWQENERLS